MGYKKVRISSLDNAVYVDEDRDILVFVTGHGTGTVLEPDEEGNTDGTAATRGIHISSLGLVRNVVSVGDGYSIVSGIQGTNVHFKGITGVSGIYISGTHSKADAKEYTLFASGLSSFSNLGDGYEIPKSISSAILNCRTIYGTGDVASRLSANKDMVIIDSKSAPIVTLEKQLNNLPHVVPFYQETVYRISPNNVNPIIALETGWAKTSQNLNKNGTSAIVVTDPNTRSVTLKSVGSNLKRQVIHKQLGRTQYVPGRVNYIFLKYISGSQNICATDTPLEVSPNIFYSICTPRSLDSITPEDPLTTHIVDRTATLGLS